MFLIKKELLYILKKNIFDNNMNYIILRVNLLFIK